MGLITPIETKETPIPSSPHYLKLETNTLLESEWNMCNEVGNGSERVFDESIELKANSLLKHHPELFYEWDFEKNDELGFNIYKMTRRNGNKVWWRCIKCKESYDSVISSRTRERGLGLGLGCPYCAGKKASSFNSLATLRPDLALEWHLTLNGELTPHDVTLGRSTNIWWIGKCGHPAWEANINSRTKSEGTVCPYCSGHKLLIGLSDMWTTNPELASKLLSPENGYKYMQYSHTKVDWKCLECGDIIKNKSIDSMNSKSFSCVKCSDDISFGEKFVYNLLKESNIEFDFDITRTWSKGKRYDFYFQFEGEEYIIEAHGGQHYKQSFEYSYAKARTLKEEQENDRFKEKLAKENGIENYIIIDCRYSTVEWIKNSILNSDIVDIIDSELINFEKIGQLASSSFVKVACDLWKNKKYSTIEIANEMKITQTTIIKYLKRGVEIGWCDYRGKNKPIVQLGKDLEFICAWESSTEAGESLGFDGKLISGVCNGKSKTTNGYRWMFKDNYESYLSGDIEPISLVDKNSISIVQLDMDSNLIEVFDSLTEAGRRLGVDGSGNISAVCKNRGKTAYGFKWMYKEDYDKLNNVV